MARWSSQSSRINEQASYHHAVGMADRLQSATVKLFFFVPTGLVPPDYTNIAYIVAREVLDQTDRKQYVIVA